MAMAAFHVSIAAKSKLISKFKGCEKIAYGMASEKIPSAFHEHRDSRAAIIQVAQEAAPYSYEAIPAYLNPVR